ESSPDLVCHQKTRTPGAAKAPRAVALWVPEMGKTALALRAHLPRCPSAEQALRARRYLWMWLQCIRAVLTLRHHPRSKTAKNSETAVATRAARELSTHTLLCLRASA